MMPRAYLLIGSHLAVALAAGCGGWKLRDADYQRHLKADAEAAAQAQVSVRQQEGRNEEVSTQVREEVSAAKVRTEIVYRTVTKEVPVYVTQTQFAKDVDSRGGLPAGLVWSYNQSASNSTAPLPTGIDPDTPSDVGVSTLAQVTAGNFAMCYSWRAEAQGWRDWYEQLRGTWPGSTSEVNP